MGLLETQRPAGIALPARPTLQLSSRLLFSLSFRISLNVASRFLPKHRPGQRSFPCPLPHLLSSLLSCLLASSWPSRVRQSSGQGSACGPLPVGFSLCVTEASPGLPWRSPGAMEVTLAMCPLPLVSVPRLSRLCLFLITGRGCGRISTSTGGMRHAAATEPLGLSSPAPVTASGPALPGSL